MVIVLLLLLVFCTTPLYSLLVPLIADGEIQIFFTAGTLSDNADTMKVGGTVLGTIELHE